MNFMYYLPAFGENNIKVKYEILIHNLEYIYKNIGHKINIIINFYSECDEIKQNLRKLDCLENIYFYDKKGVLTELFLTCPHNDIIMLCDYVLFILDDVKINNINIKEMIKIKDEYKISILSPKVINSTHPFMNTYDKNIITINNFLEVYCLLLTPDDFKLFCNLHTIENKWMWGADCFFGYLNIIAGVVHKYSVSHELPSNSKYSEALMLCNKYLANNTEFKNLNDIKKKYKPIIKEIYYEKL